VPASNYRACKALLQSGFSDSGSCYRACKALLQSGFSGSGS